MLIKKAAKEVVNAWVIEGISPIYHRQQKVHLRTKWPKLYRAINQLVKVSLESKAGL